MQDKSDCLSFDEFQAYLEEEMMESEMSVEEQVDAMFSVFDVDRSGHITTDEFRAIVGRLGAQLSPEDVDGIIEEVDEGTIQAPHDCDRIPCTVLTCLRQMTVEPSTSTSLKSSLRSI